MLPQHMSDLDHATISDHAVLSLASSLFFAAPSHLSLSLFLSFVLSFVSEPLNREL